MNENCIAVKNLNLEASGVTILREISFSIYPGEVLALVGESGAGKTLLMRGIAGILPEGSDFSLSGSIQIAGGSIDVNDCDDSPLRMAMIFQDPGKFLNPGIRVETLLQEIIRYSPDGGSRLRTSPAGGDRRGDDVISSLLQQVQLPDSRRLRRSFPHELSGGMKQRLVIAAVLASDPQLIIADEALTALDFHTGREILSLFRRIIGGTRRSLVYISHDLKSVESLADRVAVMYAGRIVEEREAASFFSAARHPYSRDLMLSHPSLRDRGGRLPEIPGDIPSAGRDFPGCPYAPRCAAANADCTQGFPPAVTDTSGTVFCRHPLTLPEGP